MGKGFECTETNSGGPIHLNTSYIAHAPEQATVSRFNIGRNTISKLRSRPIRFWVTIAPLRVASAP